MTSPLMNEFVDDSPIRDWLNWLNFYSTHQGNRQTKAGQFNTLIRLIETAINIDEQVLGVDEDGHAILGIEREDLIATLLLEQKRLSKNGS